MPTTTEQVLIEFITDDAQLDSTIDKLERNGEVDKKQSSVYKQTNAELAKRVALLKQDSAEALRGQAIQNKLLAFVSKLSGESKKAVEQLLKMNTRELAAGFDKAAVSVDDYLIALQRAAGETEETKVSSANLRTELRNLTTQLGQLKLAGEDNTQQYQELLQKAGQVKDAIRDAAQEISNAGSDTRGLDNVLGSVQALAGGFQVVQGAQALFGDNNEELQETLVKLNAVMAITQGLQQLQNSLQKEGALIKLADQIQTKGQIVAQTAFNIVVGQSTGALKLLKLAFAATGIGLLIILVVQLVSEISKFTSSTEEAAEAQERLNQATANLNQTLVDSNKAYVDAISQRKKLLEDELAIAEAKGESDIKLGKRRLEIAQEEKNIAKASLENLELTEIGVARLQLTYDGLTRKLNALAQVVAKDPSERTMKSAETLGKQIQSQQAVILPLLQAGTEALERAAQADNDLAVIRIKNLKLLRDLKKRELDDELAALEVRLLNSEKASQEELTVQQAIVRKKAEIELNQENLTANQKLLIRTKSEKDQLELSKQFAKQSSDVALQNFISDNNRQLQQLNITNDEKLRLTEDNLFAAAEIEINAAEGNGKKIKEIEANRDAAVKAARLASIRSTLDRELQLEAVANGQQVRAAQRLADNRNADAGERFNAIQFLVDTELEASDKKLIALEEERRKKLIGDQEYNDRYDALVDDQVKIIENGEKKKRDLFDETLKHQQEQAIAITRLVIDIGGQLLGVFESTNQSRAEKTKQVLEEEKQKIEELRKAGAITEKEAQQRLKRLEIEEKKARLDQAQREKQAAVFKALLAIPQAFLQGLSIGGPGLGAIYAGFAAAQAGIIAARQVPKFNKGKKNRYTGLGEVAEQNPEIVEKEGRMYLVDKPQVIWLNPDDKVYNPEETRQIMYKGENHGKASEIKIDYDKFGEAVAKHSPKFGLNIDEEGFWEWSEQYGNFTKYLNSRRGYGN